MKVIQIEMQRNLMKSNRKQRDCTIKNAKSQNMKERTKKSLKVFQNTWSQVKNIK